MSHTENFLNSFLEQGLFPTRNCDLNIFYCQIWETSLSEPMSTEQEKFPFRGNRRFSDAVIVSLAGIQFCCFTRLQCAALLVHRDVNSVCLWALQLIRTGEVQTSGR